MRRWLRQRNKPQKWLAARVGVSETYFTLILRGAKKPSLKLATAIEDETGIPASEWWHSNGRPAA